MVNNSDKDRIRKKINRKGKRNKVIGRRKKMKKELKVKKTSFEKER